MTDSKPIDIWPKKEAPKPEPEKSVDMPQKESVEKGKERKPDEFRAVRDDFSEKIRQTARGTPELGKKLSEQASRTGSSAESLFESRLKEAMSGERKSIPLLPKGKKATFAPKTDAAWRTFFANVSLRGSREQPATRTVASMVDAFFRGLFKGEARQKGTTLVTDLKFMSDGKELTAKFARVVLEEPATTALEKFSPGDPLESGFFLKGEELNYTALVPVTEGGDEKGGAELLRQLRSDLNPIVSARLERSLVEERLRKETETPPEFLKEMNRRKFPFPFWYSGTGRAERRVGKPRLWVTASFGFAVVIAALIGYLLWRGF